jgi:hypothetical protein
MQTKFILAALCCVLFSGTAAAQTAPSPEPPTQVMVLGAYHFRAGGSDYVANQVDDYISPRRRAEIAEVLDRLEQFRPTKIVIELEPQHEAEFNARYARYRAGAEALGVNERDQIGMALAARLGHERLYAADFSNGMDFDAMLGAARAAGQTRLLARFEAAMATIQAQQADDAALSVRERLARMNTPEAQAPHAIYMTMAQMGARDNPVGAREMGNWWTRNMVIFAQIAQVSEPGDRVLVIYGQGHKFLLDQYFSQAGEFELIDPLPYLR